MSDLLQLAFDATPSRAALQEMVATKMRDAQPKTMSERMYGETNQDDDTPEIESVPDIGLALEVDQDGDVQVIGVSIDEKPVWVAEGYADE